MNKRICISIDANLLLSLKKYSGELLSQTGIVHSISELVEIAVKEQYSDKFEKGKINNG